MMLRRMVLLGLTMAVAVLGVPGARAGTRATAGGSADNGLFLSSLPAGQGNSVNAIEAALFEATGQCPPHFTDQLDMYGSLPTQVANVTDQNLTDYFKQAPFGV